MKQTIRLNENQLNRLVKQCVKRIFENFNNFGTQNSVEELKKNVEHELKTLNGYETIGEHMRKLGFKVEWDGKTICNFSRGNVYFYASNHNTPFWKLDDVRIFERNNTSYDLNENFSVGDKVGTFPKSPSAVGYNGSFGTIKMIRPNNGKTMYYVQMYNSDNGAWFYEDEIVKEV